MIHLLETLMIAVVWSFAALVLLALLPAPKRTKQDQQARDEWSWYLRGKGR